MKLSVVIPCIRRHRGSLSAAINSCLNQSCRPHEIIVVGSPGKITNSGITRFLNFNDTQSAGLNRQIGSDACQGDLVIYQDADDTSHPKRFETIVHFFEKYDIVHLNHSYLCDFRGDPPDIDLNNIREVHTDQAYKSGFPNGTFEECLSHRGYGEYAADWPIHGVPAIRREVLDTVKWRDNKDLLLKKHRRYPLMEDFEFNHEVVFKLRKSIIIDAPIYFYR